MDNQRLFLWGGFLFVLYLLYQQWVTDYRQPPPAPATAPQIEASTTPPVPGGDELPGLPDEIETTPADDASGTPAPAQAASGRRIRVVTDVFSLEIDTLGGDIRTLVLLDYPVNKNEPDVPVQLLDDAPGRVLLFQTGLRAQQGAEPNHLAQFTTERDEYRLADGADELVVTLNWDSGDGLNAAKTYTFRRGQYAVGLEQTLKNRRREPWAGASYIQLRNYYRPTERSFVSVDSYSYIGPVFFDGQKYDKIDVEDLQEEPLQETITGAWFAAIQHHFLAAAVPDHDREIAYSSRMLDSNTYLLSAINARAVRVEPGSEGRFASTLFLGPKLQKQLRKTAPKLNLTVDYGFLTLLADPLFWVLSKIHSVVGNWGWAIILLTILIKLIFYKLAETSGRSMAKMRRLQPRMKALQERYKDDRQALSKAMMEMYRDEGANPMSGCLPILVQMPVFIALYWVLIESVELRQAPWALWINDLSSKDPYFVLPVLMGVTMLAQQKLNPAPPDPVQAKVMMVLPIVFTVFFAFFPAGLVLYWFVNNLLSILQQWRINTVVEREYKHKK